MVHQANKSNYCRFGLVELEKVLTALDRLCGVSKSGSEMISHRFVLLQRKTLFRGLLRPANDTTGSDRVHVANDPPLIGRANYPKNDKMNKSIVVPAVVDEKIWHAWVERNAQRDKADARRFKIVAGIVLILLALVGAFYLLAVKERGQQIASQEIVSTTSFDI